MIRLLTAVLLFASFHVVADVTLTPLNNNTPADADDVMGNFNALNAAIPLVWSDMDDSDFGTTVVEDSSMRTINGVELTVPTQGVVVVSGGVFVNQKADEEALFAVNVLMDGQNVLPSPPGNQPWVTAVGVPGRNAAYRPNLVNIAYTITVPVSAGAHNIQQQLGHYLLGDEVSFNYFYNKNFLTVQYYPESQASLTSSPQARDGEEAPANPIGPMGE